MARIIYYILISIPLIGCIQIEGQDVVGMCPVKKRPSRGVERDYAGFDYVSIPKTMSTITKLVLCDLVRRQRRLERRDLAVGDGNICVESKWFDGLPPKNGYAWKSPKNRTALFILRDPIERFVSMYSYLCHQNKFCGAMDIHEFSERAYKSLITQRVDEMFKDSAEVYRDLQPSFWYVYEKNNALPDHPTFMYMTPNKQRNAIRMARIFQNKGNVPVGVAKKVVEKVKDDYANTLRNENGKRDTELLRAWRREVYEDRSTFLNVFRSYYNDYRLLKLELSKELRVALKKHGIKLTHRLERLNNGRRVLRDGCGRGTSTSRTQDYTRIPEYYC